MTIETVRVKRKLSPDERIQRLRTELLQTKPQLSCERLYYLLEAYRETEGQPVPIRRATVLDKFLRGKTISIDENPIVGASTKHLIGIELYPEISCEWMGKEMVFATALGESDGVITEADKKLIDEAVDYWRDKCISAKTKDLWSQESNEDSNDIRDAKIWRAAISHPVNRVCIGYERVLNKGLTGIIKEAEGKLRELPVGNLEALRKRDTLSAMIIVLKAVIAFAERYATLAKDMAQKETDPERRRELEEIAAICQRVPANPARTFREAMQSFWFVHLVSLLEHFGVGLSPGRFSQYMYPFYKRDKEEGRLTEEEATGLLELLFIKLTANVMALERSIFRATMGSLYQNISLGGLDKNGDDATNELDFLLIEAQKRIRLIQPTLSILYHDKLPYELLLKAVDLVKTGIGMPAFFNFDVTVQRLLNHGVSLEDARNCSIIGCVEGGLSHTSNSITGSFLNFAKMLELALNNGWDPVTKKQLGPQTGEPTKFQSYEELQQAVKEQFQYWVHRFTEFENTTEALLAESLPKVFQSALVDDCIDKGKDIYNGGARYNMQGLQTCAAIDLADSLAAIKKLVFDEKSITMEELLKALRADFKGYEELHKMLLDAPKYGNDDDYVDQIAKKQYDIFYQEHQKYRDYLGDKRIPSALSITQGFDFGLGTMALPSGRKAGAPLCDGSVSPEPGKDTNGPTALIRSATKILDTTRYASNLLNMKFHPSALKEKEGSKKLLALVKTYMDLGGHHVQFNVVSVDTLKDAQLHPDDYRDLIVRVAGFSAFYIHLDQEIQNDIIKRTELNWTR